MMFFFYIDTSAVNHFGPGYSLPECGVTKYALVRGPPHVKQNPFNPRKFLLMKTAIPLSHVHLKEAENQKKETQGQGGAVTYAIFSSNSYQVT